MPESIRRARSIKAEMLKILYAKLMETGEVLRSEANNLLIDGGVSLNEIKRQDSEKEPKKQDAEKVIDEVFKQIKNSSPAVIISEKDNLKFNGPISDTGVLKCPMFEKMIIMSRYNVFNESKQKIADKTLELLLQDSAIHSVYFTLGTTVFYVAQNYGEMENHDDENVLTIYTNSIPILCELGPKRLVKPFLLGDLNLNKGTAYNKPFLKIVQELNIDAVVCSFSGFSFDVGFASEDQLEDESEKCSNLIHNKAQKILIPLCWEKFGIADVEVTTIDQLCPKKKYTIILNPPSDFNVEGKDKKYEIQRSELVKIGNVKDSHGKDIDVVFC